MLPVQTARFFVRFRDGITIPNGFRFALDYPVFAVDRIYPEEGEPTTEFLLCNSFDSWCWIDAKVLKRVAPPKRFAQQNTTHKAVPVQVNAVP